MKINMGKIDRIIRLFLGAGLVAGGFFTAGVIAIVLWTLGGIMLITAATGICPLYMPFGISTDKAVKK